MKREAGPRVGRVLARLLLPRDHHESVVGDLEELHVQRVRTLGRTRASLRYVRDVLSSAAAIAFRRRRAAVDPRDDSLGFTAASRFAALGPDSKLALRMLVKNPMLTVVGGLGMAVAIAMATGLFTFLTFYYSHPPLDDGDRMITVENVNVRVEDSMQSSLFEYHVWREELESVEDLVAYRDVPGRLEIPGGSVGVVPLAVMTASGFQLARVPPRLGRYLLDADELEGSPPVVVIGHEEWRRDFASDPNVVGRQVRLDGTAHTVVGVMPEGFRFPLNHGYWTALRTGRSLYGPGEGPAIHVFGRLAPGVGRPAAQAEVAAIGARLEEEYPERYEDLRGNIVPYVRHLLDLQQYPAWIIWSSQILGALLLALIAVNVAVLFYARIAIRRAELTVRTALGAARGRIVRQLFIEALALSALAAAIGLAIAEVGYRQLTAIPDLSDDLPYWLFGSLPTEAIPYALGLAVLAAFIIGVLPALQATGRNLQSTLRQMGGATGVKMGRTWTALIVVQVAVAVAALPAVVGIAWEAFPAGSPTPRFPTEESFAFLVGIPGADAGSDTARTERDRAALQVELLQRVQALPAVAGVTFASGNPASRVQRSIEIEGTDVDFLRQGGAVSHRVDPSYFDVLGASMLAGRGLGPADRAADATAVVVNRSFVEVHLEGGEVLGRRVRAPGRTVGPEGLPTEPGPWYEIVGVVEDLYVVSERNGRGIPSMYRAIGPGGDAPLILVRTRGTIPADLRAQIGDIVRDVAPGYLLTGGPLDEFPRTAGGEEFAFIAALVGLITTSVLLLSAAGISALMSFAVTRRRREIGIRTALGASRGRVVTSVFARSTRQLALGLLLGAAGAALVDRMMAGEMLGDRAPVLLAIVAALMLFAGLLAAWGPARRALRIQPMEALRQE